MRYHFSITHVPGKCLITANTVSHAPASTSTHSDSALQAEVTAFMSLATDTLPASDKRLKEIHSHQAQDELCGAIAAFCLSGWPDRHQLSPSLKPYWT